MALNGIRVSFRFWVLQLLLYKSWLLAEDVQIPCLKFQQHLLVLEFHLSRLRGLGKFATNAAPKHLFTVNPSVS